MNWNEKAEDYANSHHTYEHLGYGENMRFHKKFIAGARWQRDQLRTDEAVERAARGIARLDLDEEWPDETIIDDEYKAECHETARTAIDALLGEG